MANNNPLLEIKNYGLRGITSNSAIFEKAMQRDLARQSVAVKQLRCGGSPR